ncbi:Orcokinin peptides type A [Sarcoptes scabiei]|uniref:Orcokinin peptides type A n=2 Tax=Sarcoptes scabiei TaxID=52283 RepID=A0A834RG11_SARSC|nr:Orcokinin peptides type A [Sarcoptes scabiei]
MSSRNLCTKFPQRILRKTSLYSSHYLSLWSIKLFVAILVKLFWVPNLLIVSCNQLEKTVSTSTMKKLPSNLELSQNNGQAEGLISATISNSPNPYPIDLQPNGFKNNKFESILYKIKPKSQKLMLVPKRIFSKQFTGYDQSGPVIAWIDDSLTALPIEFRSRRSRMENSKSNFPSEFWKRNLDPMVGLSFGSSKRAINFDEIDRAGFSGFAKRNLNNYDELDYPNSYDRNKKHRDTDFDEMDHSGFIGFSKRNSDFDEIDHSGFNGFA